MSEQLVEQIAQATRVSEIIIPVLDAIEEKHRLEIEAAKVEGFLLGIEAAADHCHSEGDRWKIEKDPGGDQLPSEISVCETMVMYALAKSIRALKDRAAQIAGGSDAD